MSSHEVTFWGPSLKKWADSAAVRTHFSPRDAHYLTTVGLPTGVDWTLDLTPPADAVAVVGQLPVIGSDGGVPLVIDRNGHVLVAEPRGPRFVNETLIQFGRFLVLFQDYRMKVPELSERDALDLIESVRAAMEDVDESALDDDAYWSLVVEQMTEGLL